MNPPRALWVSFYLGRPFGVPDDPDFQRDVLRAALHLLPALSTHGIVDYPIDAPAASFSDTWACPVAFAAPDSDTLAGRLRAEVLGLAPWWRETHRARGRSVVGGSGPVAGEDVPTHAETLAAVLAAVAEGAELDRVPDAGAGVAWGHPMPYLLRHIAQDLRSYYQEAVVAQPGALAAGQAPSHRALNNWIFTQTVLGEAIHRGRASAHRDRRPPAARPALLDRARGLLARRGHARRGPRPSPTAWPWPTPPTRCSAGAGSRGRATGAWSRLCA